MLKRCMAAIYFLLFLVMVNGQNNDDYFGMADDFFGTYVQNGRVDYKALVGNSASLDKLLALAKDIEIPKDRLQDYQAFWINGYNLLVIKSIVDNYPIKSPLDKPGFFDGIEHEIGGRTITLNAIEHKLLRAEFPEEPRFHFVLVCAGLGCPPIIESAYLPSTLEAQLEMQTRLALNNPNFIRVDKKKVRISQIFQWYKKDFTQNGMNLVAYINQYRKEKLPEKAKTSFYEYNWALNEIE